MAERVITGGTVTFEYEKGHSPKLKENEKQEIDNAYQKYYERKRRERKRRNVIIAIIIIIILTLLFAAIFLKNF